MTAASHDCSKNAAAQSAAEPVRLEAMRPGEREKVEDLLRELLECEYRGEPASGERLFGHGGMSREATLQALARGAAAGLIENAGTGWRLTPTGREAAVLVMRAHRLIETRLARESSVPAARWHELAHAAEHRLTRDEVNRLADALDNPRFDPHGDPIPTREGVLPEAEGEPLLAWHVGEPGVITHVEDEPPSLFARLVADGVFAGMRFTLLESMHWGCKLRLEGRMQVLPLELASLVRVRSPLATDTPVPAGALRLSDLGPGDVGRVVALLPGCIGAERSRMLDLGFVPGSRIEPEFQSVFDGPVAYSVRGTLIGLRRSQAQQVLVQPIEETSS
jgi:DtxR family Mn-dependent transcriptional regulator